MFNNICVLSSDDDTSINDSNNGEILIDSDDESKLTVSKDEHDVRTKGELDINDLPPIEDLKISVEESECEPVGCVKNIVGTLGKCMNRKWLSKKLI